MERPWPRGTLPTVVALMLAGSLLVGCSSISYYGQAVAGHLEVLGAVRPVEEVLADPAVDAGQRRRIESAMDARRFAVDTMGLPDNGSYTGYAALDRRYVVWNVVAAPPLSLEPRRFCFLVVGCLAYRGYYDRADAREAADALRERGDDVMLGGVRAYSTLGWLNDPLLDTMLSADESAVAELLFHELTHQAVYVKDDTAFNEALATAVARAGVVRWLEARGIDPRAYRERAGRERVFLAIVDEARADLRAVYASDLADAAKHEAKRDALDAARARFAEASRDWPEPRPYARFFDEGLNNARLAVVATYHEWVPAFDALLREENGDFRALLARVRELADRPAPERRARMAALLGRADDAQATRGDGG